MKTNLSSHGHLMLGKDYENAVDNNDDGDDDSGGGRSGCIIVATFTLLHEMTRWLSCWYCSHAAAFICIHNPLDIVANNQ